MNYDAVLIDNLFPLFGRACCHHLHFIRRSIVMQIYTFDTQLASDAKNCGGFVPWKIVILYLLRSCFLLIISHLQFSFITEVDDVGTAKSVEIRA